MNLSPHFTLAELTFSQTATRLGIDNTPTEAIEANLRRLCGTLEQVRALVGRPIRVSSGYRSCAVNAAVGSGPGSAHVLGLAADFTCSGLTPKALAVLIRESDIEFDQLIYEGTWVHIGLATGLPRREVLTANFSGGHATYTRGIA